TARGGSELLHAEGCREPRLLDDGAESRVPFVQSADHEALIAGGKEGPDPVGGDELTLSRFRLDIRGHCSPLVLARRRTIRNVLSRSTLRRLVSVGHGGLPGGNSSTRSLLPFDPKP